MLLNAAGFTCRSDSSRRLILHALERTTLQQGLVLVHLGCSCEVLVGEFFLGRRYLFYSSLLQLLVPPSYPILLLISCVCIRVLGVFAG